MVSIQGGIMVHVMCRLLCRAKASLGAKVIKCRVESVSMPGIH